MLCFFLITTPPFSLKQLRAKTVKSCRVEVRIVEALGQWRAGILSPESCNPELGMTLPRLHERLRSLKTFINAPKRVSGPSGAFHFSFV